MKTPVHLCSANASGSYPSPRDNANPISAVMDAVTAAASNIAFAADTYQYSFLSRDGKKILFSSNRNNGGTRDTNVFVADWNDGLR